MLSSKITLLKERDVFKKRYLFFALMKNTTQDVLVFVMAERPVTREAAGCCSAPPSPQAVDLGEVFSDRAWHAIVLHEAYFLARYH